MICNKYIYKDYDSTRCIQTILSFDLDIICISSSSCCLTSIRLNQFFLDTKNLDNKLISLLWKRQFNILLTSIFFYIQIKYVTMLFRTTIVNQIFPCLFLFFCYNFHTMLCCSSRQVITCKHT